MNRFLLVLSFFLLSPPLSAQHIQHVDPPFWWAGMQHSELQILVHGPDIGTMRPQIDYPGVILRQRVAVESPDYLFLQLEISPAAQPGKFDIQFYRDGGIETIHTYELKARQPNAAALPGFTSADVLYLITPDRFANGDPSNDEVAGMREGLDRSLPLGRHGGDIQGIIDHLDYIDEMGFTAIWLNPLLENNQPHASYHGYATTDFYQVDPRYGSNEDYRRLCEEARKRGIKVIMDMIFNHIGTKHWWMDDLPSSDWLNYPDPEDYQQTNHRKFAILDPHAAPSDRNQYFDGWFVRSMPDLNQRNPLLAEYLIQNSIWWTEYLGLGGIRMDTYSYPDLDFMADWTCRYMAEYPNQSIVGEEWVDRPAMISYFQAGKVNTDGYVSCLPSLMDFPLQNAMSKGLNDTAATWGQGWNKVYETLSQDFLYGDPYKLVVFPDNHDMSRIFTQLNESLPKLRSALAFVLTTRGTPQIYYGTEILMSNPGTEDHGIIRSDFPGGWDGDEVNAFTGKNLGEEQKATQEFVKKLLNWRKGNEVVHNGKLTHYAPGGDGIYVYFRELGGKKVMVILNNRREPGEFAPSTYAEMIGGSTSGKEIISGRKVDLQASVPVPAGEPMIIELD